LAMEDGHTDCRELATSGTGEQADIQLAALAVVAIQNDRDSAKNQLMCDNY